MNYNIINNTEKNGLEIYFEGKPAEEIRDALKALRFRWHGVKKCWYGRADMAAVLAALGDPAVDASGAVSAPAVAPAVPGAVWPKINLDGLEKNKKECCGAEFAAVVRADLKQRGVTGVTIRAGKATYTDTIRATITMKPEDFRSAEEAAARDGWVSFFNAQNYGVSVGGVWYHSAGSNSINCGSPYTDNSAESNFPILRAFFLDRIRRFSFNEYHMTPERNREITAAALERLTAIVKIIQSYNWDRSDSMTDYFDVGFYLDIDIKMPKDFEPREFMTEAERVQLAADLAAEEEAERQRFEAYERERAAREEAEKRAAEQAEKDRAEILADVTVEDLPEGKQFYVFGVSGGIGKECSVSEIESRIDRKNDTLVSRKVIFSSAAAFEKFSDMLLDDWAFLAGMGGTATNDPRVTDENISKLNRFQRQSVKFYSADCVAIYLGDVLKLVVDPQGFHYARYTYIVTNDSTITTPEESADITAAEEAEEREPFYIPAPITEQADALPVGEVVTVYQPDNDLLNILKYANGVLTAVYPGTWAQYSGIYIVLQSGRKETRIFCAEPSDIKETVIYRGLPLSLPENVIYKSVRTGTDCTWREYRDAHDQIRQLIRFYSDSGREPVLDTVQR